MRLGSLECRGCVGVGGDGSVAEGTLGVELGKIWGWVEAIVCKTQKMESQRVEYE